MQLKAHRERLDVQGADLAHSHFSDTALSDASFIDVDLRRSFFTDVNLSHTTFDDVDFSNVSITGSNLAGMRINGILVTELLRAHQIIGDIDAADENPRA